MVCTNCLSDTFFFILQKYHLNNIVSNLRHKKKTYLVNPGRNRNYSKSKFYKASRYMKAIESHQQSPFFATIE